MNRAVVGGYFQDVTNNRVSSSRENVTVLACASAAGVVMPPMFVVKSLHSFNTAPPNSKWTWQVKAWMEDSLGIEWFREVLWCSASPSFIVGPTPQS
ncbi:hypothetical protein LSH36_853g00018 [Paralvinella palmiformis]|uniref:DDE-1 domain-containing protein n=1 Tax=Paralvinella palmiformis TaxID=53620 RepID=A0AAD9MTA1_9ANNE|nr:hypothetical protein LSH36_853g00018 [Paralvinella palmiformis]